MVGEVGEVVEGGLGTEGIGAVGFGDEAGHEGNGEVDSLIVVGREIVKGSGGFGWTCEEAEGDHP